MKCILWGTGSYYNKFKHLFDYDIIEFIVDNNIEKQGMIIDGREVCSSDKILESDYDYIIVLVRRNEDILKWLEKNNIDKSKIRLYSQLDDIVTVNYDYENKLKDIQEWTNNHLKKKIMMFFPSFSRTGAPVAMMNLAVILKNLGYDVIVTCLYNGFLTEDLKNKQIDFMEDIEDIALWYSPRRFKQLVSEYDAVVIGCTVMAHVGNLLKDLAVPIMWWLHESDNMWYENIVLPDSPNIYYYGVGDRVINKFHQEYPNMKIENLYYCIPPIEPYRKEKNERKRFAVIGSLCNRKAQDIFIKAINNIQKDIREKAVFYIVGAGEKEYQYSLVQICNNDVEIIFIPEMSQSDIKEFYKKLDVLVCPSRDDPMPIVVTEAIQNGIPCIISDQIGQKKIMDEYQFGEVFESENIAQLQFILEKYIQLSDEELANLTKNGNDIYNNYFSVQSMEENIKNVLKLMGV